LRRCLLIASLALVNTVSAVLYASIFLALRGTWIPDLDALRRSPTGWREEQYVLVASALLAAALTPELAMRLRRLPNWPCRPSVIAAARHGVWRGYAVVFGACALVPVFMALQSGALVMQPWRAGVGLIIAVPVYALAGGLFWAVMTTPIVVIGGTANAILTAVVAHAGASSPANLGTQRGIEKDAAAEQGVAADEAR
jgi:hypothetical protein